MDRRRLVIIFVSVFLALLLLIIILLLIFKPFSPKEVINTNTNTNTAPEDSISRQVEQLPPPSPERVADEGNYPLGVKQFALSYAERFASYSSDARGQNLEDLKDISTNRLDAYLDGLITQAQSNTGSYEAVEARALSSVLSYTTGVEASIIVSLQLSQFNDSRSEFTSDYRKIEIKCVKNGDEWQADEVAWQ